MARASNLRMAALVSAVVLAAMLPPLAYGTVEPTSVSARPSGPGGQDRARRDRRAVVRATPSAEPPDDVGLLAGLGLAPSSASSAPSPSSAPGDGSGHGSVNGSVNGSSGDERQAASCGPQLGSPYGVEAQTCVIGESGETWARTYYRNATGKPLTGVLTLMQPDGRTVQVPCPIGAGGGPGACETPRRRTAGVDSADAAYNAVTEIGSENRTGLLLRAASNS